MTVLKCDVFPNPLPSPSPMQHLIPSSHYPHPLFLATVRSLERRHAIVIRVVRVLMVSQRSYYTHSIVFVINFNKLK
jgi:hypothetical protein